MAQQNRRTSNMGRKRKLDNVINVHSLGDGYLPLGDAQRPESRLCKCLLKLYFGGHVAASTIQEVAFFPSQRGVP